MSTLDGISRRQFCKLVGGGIVVLMGVDPAVALAQQGQRIDPKNFSAYLVVGEDGRVTVFSGKIEMGQGISTSLAQMAAEELGVELAAIDMVLGDTARCPWDMGTFGSLTTRMFGPALRTAAAEARAVIRRLAAEQLGVPPDMIVTRNGVASLAGDPARALSYAVLAKKIRVLRISTPAAVLRSAVQFELMGTSPVRSDALAKVTGAAKYAADMRQEGMLYACLLRPPMHGATRTALDLSAAGKLPGVLLVQQDDLVAVLHADPDSAAQALGRIQAQWRAPPSSLDQDSIFEHIVRQSSALRELDRRGNIEQARTDAARLFETRYQKGYVAHAPIEPHAALAVVGGGRATVWASTQTPFPTRDRIAKSLGYEVEQVRVITPFLGGGFGGKSADGQAIEAARLAQICGRPVQVAWSRAEEFFNDTFDPAAVAEVVSALDRDGRISLWDYTVYAAGERGSVSCYDLPNVRIRASGRTSYGAVSAPGAASTPVASVHPFAVGPWRGPGANMNVFAIESQIDSMAAALGEDALAFRLRHISDPRMRRVLQAAAESFGWHAAPAPGGGGRGIACSIDAGTYVATMAQVQVDADSGNVRVLRMVCAQDMGIVVNPDGAKMQIEGGLTMGLGYALSEELRFRGGEIADTNFNSYRIPHFSWVPRIESVLIRNNELAPQGGGEPAITTSGAVLANAVFDATGVRLNRLPMTPSRVLAGLAAQRGAKAAVAATSI